jgi:hypothetical protein
VQLLCVRFLVWQVLALGPGALTALALCALRPELLLIVALQPSGLCFI